MRVSVCRLQWCVRYSRVVTWHHKSIKFLDRERQDTRDMQSSDKKSALFWKRCLLQAAILVMRLFEEEYENFDATTADMVNLNCPIIS